MCMHPTPEDSIRKRTYHLESSGVGDRLDFVIPDVRCTRGNALYSGRIHTRARLTWRWIVFTIAIGRDHRIRVRVTSDDVWTRLASGVNVPGQEASSWIFYDLEIINRSRITPGDTSCPEVVVALTCCGVEWDVGTVSFWITGLSVINPTGEQRKSGVACQAFERGKLKRRFTEKSCNITQQCSIKYYTTSHAWKVKKILRPTQL